MLLFVLIVAIAVVILLPVLRGSVAWSAPVALGAGLLLVVMCPYWLGLTVGGMFVPAQLFVLLALLAVLWRPAHFAWTRESVLVVALATVTLVGALVGGSDIANWADIALVWCGAFLLGMTAAAVTHPTKVATYVSLVAVLLASWAVLELLLDFHPFVELSAFGGPYNVWSPIQYRGGPPRSEAAFGHSIALGNSLVLALPFVFAWRTRPLVKAGALAVVLAGVVVTFSRGSLVSAVVTISLSILVLRMPSISRPARHTFAYFLVLFGVLLAPLYLSFLGSASTELNDSTKYRANYASILEFLRWVGPASNGITLPDGDYGYASSLYPGGVIKTVDNSLLLMGMQFGICAMVLFAMIIIATWSRLPAAASRPEVVAVAGQAFSLLTVAMITQYALLYWLCLGYVAGRFITTSRADERSAVRPESEPSDPAR